MALYRYIKSPPQAAPAALPPDRGILSAFLMITGIGILVWVAWPIISFSLTSDNLFAKTITPISDVPVAYAANPDSAGGQPGADFTNANFWYPTSPQKHVSSEANSYALSIPKLKIADASVVVGAGDLGKSLIHYGGTGLPGQYGTAVVFGHSMLPQFFSPTNYKSIFSTLPTLKVGDEILATFDGVTYRYEIFEMVVLDPTDLSALEQRFDDSYITLVTCVPPGTYWKRLNVRAKLKSV